MPLGRKRRGCAAATGSPRPRCLSELWKCRESPHEPESNQCQSHKSQARSRIRHGLYAKTSYAVVSNFPTCPVELLIIKQHVGLVKVTQIQRRQENAIWG